MRRFAYRLAVKLGHVNVDAMLASISWRQLVEWMVFAGMEPFDETREDYRSAAISATIANVNRPAKTQAMSVEDFVIRFGDEEAPKKTPKDLKAIGRMIYMFFGGGKAEEK